MNAWRRRALKGLLGALVIAGLVLAETLGGSIVRTWVPVRITGRVVDDRTGKGISGAAVLTLDDPAIVHDPARLAERWRKARVCEAYDRDAARRGEANPPAFPGQGRSTHTRDDGRFSVTAGSWKRTRKGLSGIAWQEEQQTGPEAVPALLVEMEGYALLVHPTRDATWSVEPDDRQAGTLDVGTLRLQRR